MLLPTIIYENLEVCIMQQKNLASLFFDSAVILFFTQQKHSQSGNELLWSFGASVIQVY